MSRSRNIKPGFFKNEVLVQLPFEHRLLFIGLWTVADRAGRFEDRPTKIKMEIFPADNVDVDAGLQALHDNEFILRYSCDGSKYCQVLAWDKHQNPHCKEVASTIPAPCLHRASTMPAPEFPERAGLIPDSLNLIPDSKTSSSELKSSSDKEFDSQSKENDSPKPKASPKPSHEAEKLAALLSGEIRRNSPNFRITPGQLRKWAVVADLMLRRDHRSYDEIAGIIRWCQADEFWRTNILSFDKLREKFDQLRLKAEPVRRRSPSEGITGDWAPELDAAVCRTCGGQKLIHQAANVPGRRLVPCPDCSGSVPTQPGAADNSLPRKPAQDVSQGKYYIDGHQSV
jgi:hypothetical protein